MVLCCPQVAIKSISAALNIHGFHLCVFLCDQRTVQSSDEWERSGGVHYQSHPELFPQQQVRQILLCSSHLTLTRCKRDNLLCNVVVVYAQGSHAHIYIHLPSTGAKRTTCCSITKTKSLTEDPPAGPPLYVQHKRLYASNANSLLDDFSEAVDVEPLCSCERDNNNNNVALWSCTSECLNQFFT